jgi:hypothetical protein
VPTLLRAGAIGARTLLVAVGVCSVSLAAEKPIRFWNLTSATVTELRLAPVGSGKFGADQCKNDKDGSVDHDERLPITGVTPGRYDLKIGYKGGKTCMVANVAIESGKAFSIEDKDLNDCSTGAR